MSQPIFFSVIVAVRNAAPTIRACIDSVLSQVGASFELVIIDAVSTDGTQAIVQEYQSRLGYFVSEPDKGISDAWNKGIAKARGQWLYFLGADDQLAAPTVLQDVQARLQGLDADRWVAYGQIEMYDGEHLAVRGGRPWMQVEQQFKSMMAIPHQGTFHHRQLFANTGKFDLSFKIAADYELLLRHLSQTPPIYLGDLVIAKCGIGGLSTQYNYRVQTLREFRRAAKMHLKDQPTRLTWYLQMAKAKVLANLDAAGFGGLLGYLARRKRSLFLR